MKFCSNCNKFVSSDSIKNCPYCGSRFDNFNESDEDYETAEKYFYGKGVKKNYLTALKYYKKAARRNFPKALNDVGEFYYYGYGIDEDKQEAFNWYIKAAVQCYAPSEYNLGYMYYHGKGIRKNIREAISWIKKSAEHGYDEAQYWLGNLYSEGKGVKKDLEKALYWYKRAAEQEHEDAQYAIGNMYYHGQGATKDREKAYFWFKKAAYNGNLEAKELLKNDSVWNEGNMKVCSKCKKSSYSYFEKCPYCGSEFESSYRNKPEDHVKKTEDPVPNNKPKRTITVQEAYEWGEKFYYGNGVEKNLVKALIMYLKAAEKGHVDAQYSVGYMYYYGESTSTNEEEAFKWCSKAANQGHAKAQFLVADMYSSGRGVDKNLRTAFSWYKKAAEQNHDRAQFELGNMYLRGICVKNSYKKAIELFQNAADNGNRDAKRLLKDLVWDGKKKLYVYKGNNYCLREHHDIISATAILKGRDNPRIELTVDYCINCHKFFINIVEYDIYRKKYCYLLGPIFYDQTSSQRIILPGGFSGESPLMLRGYNVKAQKGLTKEERHLIIANILDQKDMTKTVIKDYLNRFIVFNGSKEGNENARQKWKCDLRFTLEYKKKEQPEVTITEIKKHKTQPKSSPKK